MYMEQKKRLVLVADRSAVYQYLKNMKNYLKGYNQVTLSNEGKVAVIDNVPFVGEVKITITELVRDSKVTMSSSKIGTKAEFILRDSENPGSVLEVAVKCEPSLGILKNAAILAAAPKLFDRVIEELKNHFKKEEA